MSGILQKDFGTSSYLIKGSKRPLMLFIRDKAKKKYHAVVADGYKYVASKLYLHINMGSYGKYNDWYDFDKAINKFDDASYRRIITIKVKK